MTIGQRAVECIERRAWDNNTTVEEQCNLIDVDRSRMHFWRKSESNPNASVLAEMCRLGYDVKYILTGEKT
jgi:hypothetical protein